MPTNVAAALAALASKRGVRGFSRLVEEAIDLYLAEQRRDRLDEALSLEGALSDEQAQELERRIAEAWATWRPAS